MSSERKQQWSFFQIIHPLIIQKQELGIPKMFVRKYAKDLSNVAVLEDPKGKVWNVILKRSIDGEIFFKKGWHDFVQHYCIRNGHFLAFRYHGNSVFHVRIYDITCCEIEYVSYNNTEECLARTGVGKKTRYFEKAACYHGKQKEVISLDADSSSDDESNTFSQQQSLSWNGGIKDAEDQTDTSNQSNSLIRSESRHDIQCSVQGKEVEEENSMKILYTKRVNNPPVLQRSRRRSVARSENKRNRVEETGHQLQPITSSSQPVSQGNRKLGTNGSGKSKQEVGMCDGRAIHEASQFKSENPFCVVNMRSSYVNGPWMYLPYRFMETYAKKIDYITLAVSNNGSEKAWRCYLRRYNSARLVMIYDGWKVFVAETKLKDGDVCVFELINAEHYVFNVSIFRD